jgi:polyhydroxyalkanoate synthesis regulator phasin
MADDPEPRQGNRAEAVRAAVDQAFQTAPARASRERAQDLVGELAGAAGRVRGVIDDLRPTTGEELKALRDELKALERRVAALERQD